MAISVSIVRTEIEAKSFSLYQIHSKILSTVFYYTKYKRKYDTTVVLDRMEIDINSSGIIMSIDINYPKNKWIITEAIETPKPQKEGMILLDSKLNIDVSANYYSNHKRDCLYVEIMKEKDETIQISNNVFVDVHKRDNLAGIWFCDIRNDFLYIKEMTRRVVHH